MDRAKQFLPFDALKGFKEALLLKEIEMEKEFDEKNSDFVSNKTVPIDINGKIYSGDKIYDKY